MVGYVIDEFIIGEEQFKKDNNLLIFEWQVPTKSARVVKVWISEEIEVMLNSIILKLKSDRNGRDDIISFVRKLREELKGGDGQ